MVTFIAGILAWLVLTAILLKAQTPESQNLAKDFVAQSKTAAPRASLDAWKSDQPPFYFKYDGKASPDFITNWTKTEDAPTPSEGGETHHYIYADPATKLTVRADVRTYKDFDAIDWVLHITNNGSADTPILEEIKPLHWSMIRKVDFVMEHWAEGSVGGYQDFQPFENEGGPTNVFHFESNRGRSSNGTMPFFNIENGDQGIIGAIGWTGDWRTTFNREIDSKLFDMEAGMKQTHLLLHPGETIRTPRILLLNWQGGTWQDAQNTWRKLMLAHYSPREPDGSIVRPPVVDGSWGTELIDAKIKHLKEVAAAKLPYDLYWVDAGWYGNLAPKTGQTVDTNSDWASTRGDWIPSSACYPNGLGQLGDAAKSAGLGFLLWIESETADPVSKLRQQHPDWYLATDPKGAALVNLGNPEARKMITDLVSHLVDTAHMTWYRQDFNVDPDGFWHAADTPDRIGMTEIQYIEGLYQFWDDLRTRHPGLQIDNCSSGGRRLDIETASRSVSLWRSDLFCNPTDPIGGQMLTQGLAPWLPLFNGCFSGVAPGTPDSGASLLYALRSHYAAGFGAGGVPDLKKVLEEYREVQPYFIGDFYPLLGYTPFLDLHRVDTSSWTAWQWDRPDLKSGILLMFRRQTSPIVTIQPQLHGIDPDSTYVIEVRTGLDKGKQVRMSGKEFMAKQYSIESMPGSLLLLYKRVPRP